MFKSEDQKRQAEATAKGNTACSKCNGTGTVGIGGRGALSSSPCGACGGSGQKR